MDVPVTPTNSQVTPAHIFQINNFTDSQMVTLSFIYLSTSVLSLFGSFSIVIATVIKGKVLSQEVHPIFHLSLADLFGSAFLIAGAIMYHVLKKGAIKSDACPYLTASATAFYMSTFLLTLNYARSINAKVDKRMEDHFPRRTVTHFRRMGVHHCSAMLVWYGFAWFLPFMVTLCLFAIDHSSYGPYDHICSSCLPLFHYKNSDCQKIYVNDYRKGADWYGVYKYVFLLILAFSLVGAVAFNMAAYKKFRKLQMVRGVISQRQREVLKLVRRRLGLFSLAFMFCWTPSMILGVISLSPSFERDDLYSLYVIQACTCPLQGFINSLIYGWYRPGFKQAINEHTRLLHPKPPSTMESDV